MSAPTSAESFRLGAVIITMGNRPEELAALIESVRAQEGAAVELAVVGQGAQLPPLPEGVRSVELPENLGIPGGRNVGIELFGRDGRDVDAVLFLDDDGHLPRTDSARLLREAFTADPELGIVAFRIADPDTGVTQRRHVPGCAPAAAALVPGDHLPGWRDRRALRGVRAGRAAARRVLLRPRGDRPRVARGGRRLGHRLPRGRGAAPPDDLARPARHLLPQHCP